jgi:hypothetical protein
VQKPTQALQSVKCPANTFDWNPKWVRTLLSLIYFSWDIYRDPLHKRKFKYQSWYLTPYCGHEVQIPTQAFQSGKGPDNIFDWIPKWVRTLPSLIYFSWDIYRDPLHKRKFKYQSWYLTPYCGHEVQIPTQALQLGKGPDNIFHWNPKWANTKVDIWHPTVGLRCTNPPRHFTQLKAQAIPLIEAPSGQELCCPSIFVHGLFIGYPQIQISK